MCESFLSDFNMKSHENLKVMSKILTFCKEDVSLREGALSCCCEIGHAMMPKVCEASAWIFSESSFSGLQQV